MHKRGHMPSRGVRLSVRSSRSYILSKWIKISSKFFHRRVSPHHSSFFISYIMATLRREPPNGGVECRWGKQKSGFSANIWLHRMLWTLRRPAAINTIVGPTRPISDYRSMPAGTSAINWWSSVQWCITVTVQVCLRHRKPRTIEYAEEKRA